MIATHPIGSFLAPDPGPTYELLIDQTACYFAPPESPRVLMDDRSNPDKCGSPYDWDYLKRSHGLRHGPFVKAEAHYRESTPPFVLLRLSPDVADRAWWPYYLLVGEHLHEDGHIELSISETGIDERREYRPGIGSVIGANISYYIEPFAEAGKLIELRADNKPIWLPDLPTNMNHQHFRTRERVMRWYTALKQLKAENYQQPVPSW